MLSRNRDGPEAMTMTRLTITLIAAMIALLPIAAVQAGGDTSIESVRLMCSAPDNQDFSVFNQEALPGILTEIILHDPPEAEYHERVVVCALKALGAMHVSEAVGVLIEKSSEYPTTCIYWLADYAQPDAVDTIVGFLDDDDPSVRYEAADALSRLKPPDDETGDDYVFSLTDALAAAANHKDVEDDESVIEALDAAVIHLMDIILKPGTS
jgi:hypothetical protein